MNRTLRRPMFRMGGSAEGITSGLDAPDINKRGLVDGPGGYSGDDLESRYNRAMDFIQSKRAPRGSNFNDFLINLGLDLVSRPRSGNIFQQVARSARDPYAQFMAGKKEAAEQRYASESDLFKSMMEGQSDILASEAESGTAGKIFDKENTANMIKDYITKINNITSQLESPDLTEEKRKELEENLQISRTQLASVKKQSPYAAAILKSDKFVKGFVRTIMERLVQDTDKYPEGENDPNLYKDAYKEFLRYFEDEFAAGGRVGLQMGGQPMQAAQTQDQMPMDQGSQMPEELQNIDYDTLRARLPASITDDIVTLIANSAEAMEDFAMIQSQADVDMFNNKYGVELILPSEA